jgi:phage-related protein (TIGR01555 family)
MRKHRASRNPLPSGRGGYQKKVSSPPIIPTRFAKKSTKRSERKSLGLDYFVNQVARMGSGSLSVPEAGGYELERLSNNYWLMVTLYRNTWIARRVVDGPAEDMCRAWPSIVCDVSPDKLAEFERSVRRTYVSNVTQQAIAWARLYGGAGALMVIEGHEEILDKPLDLEDVAPGSFRGLIPFDRWVGIYPQSPVSEDYDHPSDWGLPEYYEVRGSDTGSSFKVHASRLLRFMGEPVPTPEFQAQMYWGISILEVIWEELRKRDTASWAILNLLLRANIISMSNPDLAGMLSGLDTNQNALKRFNAAMQAINNIVTSQSMLVLGDKQTMSATQYSFAGIGEVYQQFQMDVAGAAEYPLTRLFGRTMTGIGQSNDADERLYEEKIARHQHSRMRPQLDKLYPVIMMSEWGDIPDDWDLHFPSIRVLTQEQKADYADKAATPVLAAYAAGVISQQTALKELKALSDETGVFSNISNEDIDAADDEPIDLSEKAEAGKGGEESPERAERQAQNKVAGDAALDARSLHKRLKWHGLDVSIENEAGSTRSGKNHDGSTWTVTMSHDYGYLRNTEGVDGDHVDCFIGPAENSDAVYVVHTLKAPLFIEYDEDKCFLNFASEADARSAFFKNYDRPEHFGSLDKVPVLKFIDKVLATKGKPGQIT